MKNELTQADKDGERGTCGFCGVGDGWLGDGDDGSQVLHSAVRIGEPPNAEYQRHPHAWKDDDQFVTWCGRCVGGLKHKYQRYDDTNLNALLISSKVRLELDGIRWSHWEDASLKEGSHHPDDPAIHLDKLAIERVVPELENERIRRYPGNEDWVPEGWRP